MQPQQKDNLFATVRLKPHRSVANVGKLHSISTTDSQSNRSKLVPELKTEYCIADQARKSPQIKGERQWYGPEGGGDVIYSFNDRQGYCMACWK